MWNMEEAQAKSFQCPSVTVWWLGKNSKMTAPMELTHGHRNNDLGGQVGCAAEELIIGVGMLEKASGDTATSIGFD